MRRLPATAAFVAAMLLLGACAGADATDGGPDEPVTSTPDDGGAADPDPSDPDGVDPGAVDPGAVDAPADFPPDDFPTDEAREEARALLGMHEEDLPEAVRIGRRGDEDYALTEDYVLGRRTVRLDDDGSGFRVVAVTVELPDGPETFELQGG